MYKIKVNDEDIGVDVINDVTSTETTKPLSAFQGKLLNDRINNVSSVGRFLSLWNCETGLPITNPVSIPYAYKTGDYYIISRVTDYPNNLIPSGVSYAGVASTTTTTDVVASGDVYLFDGAVGSLRKSYETGVSDVQINDVSVVTDGVAKIPVTTSSSWGVVKLKSGNTGNINNDGAGTIYLTPQANTAISSRADGSGIINGKNIDFAVKAALTDGAGADYTDTEKEAARSRLGIDDSSFQKPISAGNGIAFNTTTNIVSANCDGTTISTNASGKLEVKYKIYYGTDTPTSSMGNDGDLYFLIG